MSEPSTPKRNLIVPTLLSLVLIVLLVLVTIVVLYLLQFLRPVVEPKAVAKKPLTVDVFEVKQHAFQELLQGFRDQPAADLEALVSVVEQIYGDLRNEEDDSIISTCQANYQLMANAMNAPFGEQGPGQVIEMNIFTGTPGLTVMNPFSGANAGTDICPGDMNAGDNAYVECPGPWKPTGVLSGGLNGHAFITSAGQQALKLQPFVKRQDAVAARPVRG